MTVRGQTYAERDAPPKGGAFRRFVWPTALALAVFAAHARSLRAQPIWDDEFLTIRNENLASLRGVGKLLTSDIWSSSSIGTASGYYRPLASLSYALGTAWKQSETTQNLTLSTNQASLRLMNLIRRG